KVFVANTQSVPASLPKLPPTPAPTMPPVRAPAAPPTRTPAIPPTPGPAAAPAPQGHPAHGVPIRRSGIDVQLSGRQFLFPRACACCGNSANRVLKASAKKSKGQRVVHTTTMSWEVPYCAACLAHVSAMDGAAFTAIGLAVIGFFIGGLAWFQNMAPFGFFF